MCATSMATHLLSRVVVVVCILSATSNVIAEAGKRRNLSRKKLEVENHLKQLNKAPIKSIKSPDGDIIDCILIKNQPAFDHPSLTNHTIQMRPSYLPKGVFVTIKDGSKRSKPIPQLWHLNGQCPIGTIPIRRTKKDDMLRASSVNTFQRKKHRIIPQSSFPLSHDQNNDNNRYQYALVSVKGDKYYGAKARINVWNPKVQNSHEYSFSQIWITGGSGDNINTVEVGWQVLPNLYGDNGTRFFISWTSDSYRTTGCYNLLCSGFIQLSSEITVGATFDHISSYGGSQYDIGLYIYNDALLGHWWLIFENEHILGYWPHFLFNSMRSSGSTILFGGEILNLKAYNHHTTTQMGSGHFAKEGFGKASYFKNIEIIDSSNLLRPPKQVTIESDQSSCYDIKYDILKGENYFFYGGPGRNSNCP